MRAPDSPTTAHCPPTSPPHQVGGDHDRRDDALDVSLHDSELYDEVELTARLMVAANQSQGQLTQDRVDDLLGLPRRPTSRTA